MIQSLVLRMVPEEQHLKIYELVWVFWNLFSDLIRCKGINDMSSSGNGALVIHGMQWQNHLDFCIQVPIKSKALGDHVFAVLVYFSENTEYNALVYCF